MTVIQNFNIVRAMLAGATILLAFAVNTLPGSLLSLFTIIVFSLVIVRLHQNEYATRNSSFIAFISVYALGLIVVYWLSAL